LGLTKKKHELESTMYLAIILNELSLLDISKLHAIAIYWAKKYNKVKNE